MNEQRNPYVGPRVYSYEDRDYFFGREREARDLLARVMSQRLVLFYAQSGAGKSSLINARLIPELREAGFAVLPVGRVGGELLAGLDEVDNIYLFNLMQSVDQSQGQPGRLGQLGLSDFLQRLVSEDGLHYIYDPSVEPDDGQPSEPYPAVPYVLIVDQFEELITTYPDRWPEREAFFRQLNQAMLADPNLWVVLTLREDYLAALDPFAILMRDRLRARFHMQRLAAGAACQAVVQPAAKAGRSFAPDVAEALVDDLRQVQIQHLDGSTFTELGPYVEPVQLQVVCYRLWGNLAPDTSEISRADLRAVGDVNQSLADYYADRVAAVRIKSGLSERSIRDWVESRLITATGMRGQVLMEPEQSGGLANEAIYMLQDAHLVRAEKRSGATWFELTHDRLVEPLRQNNAAWRRDKLSLLQRQAVLWAEQNRPEGLLLRGSALYSAESWASDYANYMSPVDVEFLDLCRALRSREEQARAQERKELEMAQKLAAVERTKKRAIAIALVSVLILIMMVMMVFVVVPLGFQKLQEQEATVYAAEAPVLAAATDAAVARITADAAEAQAAVAAYVAQATASVAAAEAQATAAAAAAAEAQATAAAYVAQATTAAVVAQATAAAAAAAEAPATAATAEAQATAAAAAAAEAQATAAAVVAQATAAAVVAQATVEAAVPPTSPSIGDHWNRPQDGAEMVYVPSGNFMMGSGSADDNPEHAVTLDGFWIDITEVTNDQFAAFVDDTSHETTAEEQGYGEVYVDNAWQQVPGASWEKPNGTEGNLGGIGQHPVVQVSWIDAIKFCTWAGGQLPTEAQWEYAGRGPDSPIYPWGNEWDGARLNFCDAKCLAVYRDASQDDGYAEQAPVGSFSRKGDSWIGASDMAGNVWEWVADWYDSDYYDVSAANNPTGPDSGELKVIRGGSWGSSLWHVRSARRLGPLPTVSQNALGFRCVVNPSN